MSAVLTMREAGAAIGYSWERFRKVWPELHKNHGFPSPFRDRTWDAEAVYAWRRARSGAPAAAPGAERALDPRRIARQRAELEALRAG